MKPLILPNPLLFEWDEGNNTKNLLKHGISMDECESAFRSSTIFIQPDLIHSSTESRFTLFAHARNLKPLIVIFTIRNNSVRVISARSMHKKEIRFYEEEARSAKI